MPGPDGARNALDRALAGERGELERLARARELPAEDAAGLDFTSNDYLALARDARLAESAAEALARAGTGGRAARLLGGGGEDHRRAERAVAAWLGAEAALLLSTGYQANLALVTALAGRGDAVVCDALLHASSIDAARLSRAEVLVHAHADVAAAERALRDARGARRRLLLTEGVFSMDGDRVDLAALAELCVRHDAWLVVDEAHSAGLLGPDGAGAWAELAPDLAARARERLAARVVTASKALGAAGGLVVGSREVIAAVVQRGRGFVFSTAPPPAIAATVARAVELVRADGAARAACLARAQLLADELGLLAPAGAIVPVLVGADRAALDAAARLRARGFDVRAVRPPTVPEGTARLRLVAHADQAPDDVRALARACRELGLPASAAAAAPARAAEPLFVVGTDTGIGKTVVAALALAVSRADGRAAYWKPVQTGDESDTETVRRLAAAAPEEWLEPAAVFRLPASPHEAAAAEGRRVPVDALDQRLLEHVRRSPDTRLVVELAGGLLVPYDERRTQADWLAAHAARVLLVARSGLGTLNHTLLTVEALARRGIEPLALVLVGEPHRSNRETLAARTSLPVLELGRLARLEGPLDLASAELAPFCRALAEVLARGLPRPAAHAAAGR